MIKKTLTIFIFVMLLTGCTAEYNLSIDKELIVEELVTIKEDTYIIKTQTLDVENFLDSTVNNFKRDSKYDKYTYKKYTDDSNTSVEAKAIYLDFQDYLTNNIVRGQIFNDIDIVKENSTYRFVFKPKTSNEIEVFKETELYSNVVDEIQIKINIPFKVIESNYDKFDIDKNEYTWTYKKDQHLKDVVIKFDITKQAVKKENTAIYFIAVVIISIVLLSLMGFYKYKKFNKF